MRADAARRGRSGVPAGAADQRRRAAVPGRCRGRAAADRGRGAGRGDRRASWAGRTRSGGRREREVDTAAEAARRELPEELREAHGPGARRRGLAPGRGRDRRLAAGRAPPPAGRRHLARRRGRRARQRAQHPRLRPARGAARPAPSTWRASAGTGPPPGSRCGPRTSRPSARPSPPTRPRCSGPEDLRRTERIDAMVGGVGLGLELAEELGQLAPFGMGNPGVRLMVPSARVSDVRTMGEGKHARFSLHSGSHRALGVAFGRSSLGVEDEDPVDAAVRLEVNHWNGSVEPRVVLRELYPLGGAGGGAEAPALAARLRVRGRGVVAALRSRAGARAPAPSPRRPSSRPSRADSRGGRRAWSRRRLRRRWRSPSSSPAAPGCSRSAPTPRAGRRWPAAPPASPASTAAPRGSPAIAAAPRRSRGWRRAPSGGLALTDYAALARGAGARRAPSSTSSSSTRRRGEPTTAARPGCRARTAAPGFLHALWTEAEREFALAALDEQCASREAVARRLPRPARGRRGERRGRCARRSPAAAPTRSARRPPPAASASCAELGLVAGERRTAARASSGSYPQRGRIWSAQPRSAPTATDHSEAPAIPRQDPNSRRAQRAPRRPLRRGRGVRLGCARAPATATAPAAPRSRWRRSTAPRSSAPSTSPASATPTSCATPATSSSPTRSGSPRSAPGCGSTPRRSARRCCTTRSRTPAPASRRSRTSSARRSPSWSTASPS